MNSEKREAQKKKREKAIKRAEAKKFTTRLIIAVVAAVLLGGIGYLIYYDAVMITKPADNYSENLNADGTIEGIDVKEYVTLCDYQNITVNYDELAPSQEELDAQIASLLEQNKMYNKKAGIKINEGDTINLDYVGTVDGVAFEGGSTSGAGTTIVVGQANYIDDFEAQLVGKEVGSTFDINVTFPDDYENEEVRGKDAVFTVTINGVYEVGEFDDEFVQTYCSDVALTAQAYRDNWTKTKFDAALSQYLQTYIVENSQVSEYPASYIKTLKKIQRSTDEQDFKQYASYFGYQKLSDYTGVTGQAYEDQLLGDAQKMCANAMIIQAIYQDAGLTISADNTNAVLQAWGADSTYYAQMKEIYGEGYLNQTAMSQAVMEYLMDTVTIEK